MMKRIKAVIVLFVLASFVLTGCADQVILKFNAPKEYINAAEGVVDQNENYTLSWDDETKCVFFKDNNSGYIWSTTPYEYYKTGETGYSLSSPLVIEYYDPVDNSVQSEKAFECIDSGTVSSEITDNKLFVTFYFTYPEISVKLCYSLNEDSLDVSVDTDGLFESGKTKLMNVTLAPYLCSVKNSDDKNSYVFVPSGSGALMYTDNDPRGASRDFSGEVFGLDPARARLDDPADEETVRLPCFGATDGRNAIMGIIKTEEGAARIDASAGESTIGYSNACVTFNIRGYNNFEWNDGSFHGNEVANDVVMLYDTWPSDREFKVGYYTLSGADADYSGMAKCYRRYLEKTDALRKSKQEQKTYQLTLLGGAQKKDFFFGVPYMSFSPITTFEQAGSICEELIKNRKNSPAVLLKGFGSSGYDVGKIAGGFEFAARLGSKKDRKSFEAFCKSSDIPLYTDFNLIEFNDSADGFSTFLHSAQTANAETVKYYPDTKNLRDDDKSKQSVKYLSRAELERAADKLVSFSKDNISGISLSSLGSISYSDYGYEEYMLKGDTAKQFSSVAKKLKDAGHPLFLSAANSYAAGISDGITEVPLQSGGYNSLDVTVPFYEMVYGGYIPLYSEPINLAYDSQKMLLKAVEAGVSPSFTLGYSLEPILTDNADSFYYGISYKSNAELINNILDKTEEFYLKTAGMSIKRHTLVSSEVTKTEFDGGITVYVNHSSKDVTIENVTVPARSFVY